MRILELCLGKGLGGLELYFRKCCEMLSASHHMVVVTNEKTRLAELSHDKDQHYYHLNRKLKSLPVRSVIRLLSIIKNEAIDIIHVHHKDDLPLAIWAKILSRKKIKVIHTRQMQLPGSKKDIYHSIIYKRLDLFIAITDQLKVEAEKKLPLGPSKIQRLYYGVEKADRSTVEHSFLKDSDKFNIGVFSRIEHQKGQHLVIKAANMLLENNDSFDFYFVGDVMDNDYMQELGALIGENGRPHFYFKGFHPKPLTIMPLFDVIVMPSRNETFGLVLVEAMRAGVAVIATDSGGVPEIIDHEENGLLFRWGDHDQLAGHLKKLYEHPDLLQKMALNGERKADTHFNVENHFKRLEKIFEEVLEA